MRASVRELQRVPKYAIVQWPGEPAREDTEVISLVVPLFNEEALIDTLHARVRGAMAGIGDDWRVYYVNDGSRDRTLEMLLRHQETDPQVVVVDLSRNWGHQAAISAGLSVAEGEAVVLMDGDLQDPPEVIPDLVAAWRNGRTSSWPSAAVGPNAGRVLFYFRSSIVSWAPSRIIRFHSMPASSA